MNIPNITKEWLMFILFMEFLANHTSVACFRGKIIRYGLSDYEKQLIVDIHNQLRQQLALGFVINQPGAANMMEMTWDEGLAHKAQQWAMCSTHDHDQRRHNSHYLVGQNIAASWTTRPPTSYFDTSPDFFTDAIAKWFNEHKNFHFQGRGFGVVGHYTQMVWAESSEIGCGYTYYLDPVRGYTKNYICNYGPSGNVLGEMPYKTGYPNCQKFGLFNSKNYQGLCDYPGSKHRYLQLIHFLR